MSTVALTTWLFAVTIVTSFTGYFFYRILTNPQKLDVPTDDEAPHGTKTFDVT